MFKRAISKTQTQTQTKPNSFMGVSNTLETHSQLNLSDTQDHIVYAIVTGNFINVKKLVNNLNVNKIIDVKNNYTALHHAVRIKRNNDIVEYLLSIGANPLIKQNEQKDAVDLAIESNYRYLIDKMLKDKELELTKIYTKYDEIQYENKNLNNKNNNLNDENFYLKKSTEQYIQKIQDLKTENVTLKRKYDDSEKAFSNLLNKIKK